MWQRSTPAAHRNPMERKAPLIRPHMGSGVGRWPGGQRPSTLGPGVNNGGQRLPPTSGRSVFKSWGPICTSVFRARAAPRPPPTSRGYQLYPSLPSSTGLCYNYGVATRGRRDGGWLRNGRDMATSARLPSPDSVRKGSRLLPGSSTRRRACGRQGEGRRGGTTRVGR